MIQFSGQTDNVCCDVKAHMDRLTVRSNRQLIPWMLYQLIAASNVPPMQASTCVTAGQRP